MAKQSSLDFKNFVQFFQAMSDQTRQKILLLLEKKDRNVSELVKEFNLSQPTISRHLLVLKQADLVSSRREGQQVYYSLNKDWMKNCCACYFGSFECCADFFKNYKINKG